MHANDTGVLRGALRSSARGELDNRAVPARAMGVPLASSRLVRHRCLARLVAQPRSIPTTPHVNTEDATYT